MYSPKIHASAADPRDHSTNNYCIHRWSSSTYGTASLKENDARNDEIFQFEEAVACSDEENDGY